MSSVLDDLGRMRGTLRRGGWAAEEAQGWEGAGQEVWRQGERRVVLTWNVDFKFVEAEFSYPVGGGARVRLAYSPGHLSRVLLGAASDDLAEAVRTEVEPILDWLRRRLPRRDRKRA